MLADATAGELALRFTLTQVIASLRQVLVVAHSRGGRLRGRGERCRTGSHARSHPAPPLSLQQIAAECRRADFVGRAAELDRAVALWPE